MRRFAVVPDRSRGRLYISMDTKPIHSTPTVTASRPLLVTVKQAGEMLALSRSSIYELIWRNELTPIRIGRSVRFAVEHLETFVADRLASS